MKFGLNDYSPFKTVEHSSYDDGGHSPNPCARGSARKRRRSSPSMQINFGGSSEEEAFRTLELFAAQVMPRFN
ncbi:MAG TPA: hypothetical protein VFZ74_10920 [Burkholderiales bacterium]